MKIGESLGNRAPERKYVEEGGLRRYGAFDRIRWSKELNATCDEEDWIVP